MGTIPFIPIPDKEIVRQTVAYSSNDGYPPDMEKRFTAIENRLDGVERRLEIVKESIDSVKGEMSGLRWWVLGVMISAVLAFASIVVGFGSYQATWFQQSLDRNWEQAQKSLDKIDATNLRMERMDAEKNQVRSPHP